MSAGLDVQRLARVLGMLGSSHDGEVAGAGRAAHAIIKQAGITWFDALAPALPAPRTVPRRPPPADVFGAIEFCLRHADALTAWEAQFLQSLQRRSSLSDKQRGIVEQIVDKVERRTTARAG